MARASEALSARAREDSTAPDRLEKALGALALILLGSVVVAVLRGHAQWGYVPLVVWGHLATVVVALVLTPVLLWRARGTRSHRVLGYGWCAAMLTSALVSFFVRLHQPGHLGPIHALSALVVVLVPVVVFAARRGDVYRHRRTVRGLVIGALLVAGAFTFSGTRLLGHWLLG